MSIQINNQRFVLETENTCLILKVRNGFLERAYYGAKILDYDIDYLRNDQILGFCPYDKTAGLRYTYAGGKYEYSGENSGDSRACAVNIIDENGYIGCRLKYRGCEKVTALPEDYVMPSVRGVAEGIKITLFDENKKVAVDLYYYIAEECDVICRFARINNEGEEKISLTAAASLQIDFENPNFEVISYSGGCGSEFRLERQKLLKGKYEISSSAGMTGHASNPFIALCSSNATEENGDCYAFNLLYSGNFKNLLDYDERNFLRLVCGINDKNFNWTLKKGESFYTPQAVATFSESGIGGASRNMHKLIRGRILPPQFNKPAPVVANTWESYGFNVTEEKFIKFAEKADLSGADTVVLDDGWFRCDDKSGLGDWQLIKDKFPDGLDFCVKKLRELNLNFGIWFEPEMISESSALYAAHPDWVLNNGDEGSESRNQYVLDLTNPAVVEYIIKLITDFLSRYPVTYLKWDANRYISEAGSKYTKNQGEVWHRYVLNLYKIFGAITEKFPDVWLEGCAGGGGRFDLGMLYYQPLIWVSDNTDPYGRAAMQYDASVAYPARVLSYHVSADEGYTGKRSDEEFRFLVSRLGGFGYEFDLTVLTADEIKKYRALADERKAVATYVENGDLYRLETDTRFYYATLNVMPDRSSALLTFLQVNSQPRTECVNIKIKGLKPDGLYEIGNSGLKLHGRTLEKAGLKIGDLLCPHWKDGRSGGVYLKKGKSGSGVSFIIKEIK